MEKNFLQKLGAYGFGNIEPVILAALISEDPLLLIGKAGTGKTFLLNSLSETLGLEHRHYNASLLSFDDLVGFPMPAADGKSVEFLPTPATVWNAESVLIDELSRCKPETQNKLFSVIHERKIQGIALPHLRYRWAAMNPLNSPDASDNDQYEGSMALDQALADRFAWIVTVPDWGELTTAEQELVIHPAGEGLVNTRGTSFIEQLQKLRAAFQTKITEWDPKISTYCRLTASILTTSGYRISPRRARLMARNIVSLLIAHQALNPEQDTTDLNALFRLALIWSVPHRAWLPSVPLHTLEAAHTQAMKSLSATDPADLWLTEFECAPTLKERFDLLFRPDVHSDTISLGVIRFMNRGSRTETAIFAFTSFPCLFKLGILKDEALQLISETASKVIHVEGTYQWNAGTASTGIWKCEQFLKQNLLKSPKRANRARQLLMYLALNNIPIPEPELVEEQLNQFFRYVSGHAAVRSSKFQKA